MITITIMRTLNNAAEKDSGWSMDHDTDWREQTASFGIIHSALNDLISTSALDAIIGLPRSATHTA